MQLDLQLTRQTLNEERCRASCQWLSMPDAPESQVVYPQPSSQAAGVGLPLARLVMVICLVTWAALDAAIGPNQGKGTGELGLVGRLLEGFEPGDVMRADALHCNYFLTSALMAKVLDVPLEQDGSRITDFRCGRSLGTRDYIVRWPKPASRPEWMTSGQYPYFISASCVFQSVPSSTKRATCRGSQKRLSEDSDRSDELVHSWVV